MPLKRSYREIEKLERKGADKLLSLGVGNSVELCGKASRVGRLAYTPGGEPILEITIAVNQQMLGKQNVGYFPVMFTGALAEEASRVLAIGRTLRVVGELWNRVYVNRKGAKTTEFRVIAHEFGGDK